MLIAGKVTYSVERCFRFAGFCLYNSRFPRKLFFKSLELFLLL